MTTTAQRTESAIKKFGKGWSRESWRDLVTGAGGLVFTHAGWDATVWVSAPDLVEGNPTGPLPPAALKDNADKRLTLWNAETFRALATFTAAENGRYHLRNAALEVSANGARITVTDGRRLASLVHGAEDKDPQHVDVDGQALSFLVDVIDKQQGRHGRALEFSVVDGALAIFNGGCMAAILRSCGNFPFWRKVIPKQEHTADLPGNFFAMFEVVGRTTSVESQAVRMTLTADGKGSVAWELRARAVPIGHARGLVESIGRPDTTKARPDHKDLAVGLDPQYVASFEPLLAAAYRSGPVALRYTDKDTGLSFEVASNPRDVLLVMPIDI